MHQHPKNKQKTRLKDSRISLPCCARNPEKGNHSRKANPFLILQISRKTNRSVSDMFRKLLRSRQNAIYRKQQQQQKKPGGMSLPYPSCNLPWNLLQTPPAT
ncbi:hypothetical protein TNCV_4645681 [Trichonephila clavipes]|nr:hypothetical protein TNCV_4645681 [Trichonephila clavipes]